MLRRSNAMRHLSHLVVPPPVTPELVAHVRWPHKDALVAALRRGADGGGNDDAAERGLAQFQRELGVSVDPSTLALQCSDASGALRTATRVTITVVPSSLSLRATQPVPRHRASTAETPACEISLQEFEATLRSEQEEERGVEKGKEKEKAPRALLTLASVVGIPLLHTAQLGHLTSSLLFHAFHEPNCTAVIGLSVRGAKGGRAPARRVHESMLPSPRWVVPPMLQGVLQEREAARAGTEAATPLPPSPPLRALEPQPARFVDRMLASAGALSHPGTRDAAAAAEGTDSPHLGCGVIAGVDPVFCSVTFRRTSVFEPWPLVMVSSRSERSSPIEILTVGAKGELVLQVRNIGSLLREARKAADDANNEAIADALTEINRQLFVESREQPRVVVTAAVEQQRAFTGHHSAPPQGDADAQPANDGSNWRERDAGRVFFAVAVPSAAATASTLTLCFSADPLMALNRARQQAARFAGCGGAHDSAGLDEVSASVPPPSAPWAAVAPSIRRSVQVLMPTRTTFVMKRLQPNFRGGKAPSDSPGFGLVLHPVEHGRIVGFSSFVDVDATFRMYVESVHPLVLAINDSPINRSTSVREQLRAIESSTPRLFIQIAKAQSTHEAHTLVKKVTLARGGPSQVDLAGASGGESGEVPPQEFALSMRRSSTRDPWGVDVTVAPPLRLVAVRPPADAAMRQRLARYLLSDGAVADSMQLFIARVDDVALGADDCSAVERALAKLKAATQVTLTIRAVVGASTKSPHTPTPPPNVFPSSTPTTAMRDAILDSAPPLPLSPRFEREREDTSAQSPSSPAVPTRAIEFSRVSVPSAMRRIAITLRQKVCDADGGDLRWGLSFNMTSCTLLDVEAPSAQHQQVQLRSTAACVVKSINGSSVDSPTEIPTLVKAAASAPALVVECEGECWTQGLSVVTVERESRPDDAKEDMRWGVATLLLRRTRQQAAANRAAVAKSSLATGIKRSWGLDIRRALGSELPWQLVGLCERGEVVNLGERLEQNGASLLDCDFVAAHDCRVEAVGGCASPDRILRVLRNADTRIRLRILFRPPVQKRERGRD